MNDKLIIQIKQCASIEELFKLWKDFQSKDEEYDKDYFISVNSFTEDGIVNREKWSKNEKGKKVLFILREANGSRSVDEKHIVDGGKFYFKDTVNSENIPKTSLFKRIQIMQKVITGSEDLSCVAYMNINKRGGDTVVDWKRLNAYATKYREFIKAEIKLINPDIIVCCGTYWQIVDQIFQKFDKATWSADNDYVYKDFPIDDSNSKVLINMWHPSARSISDDTYRKRFEKLYINSEGNLCDELDYNEKLNCINSCIEKLIKNELHSSVEYELIDQIAELIRTHNELTE